MIDNVQSKVEKKLAAGGTQILVVMDISQDNYVEWHLQDVVKLMI